MAEADGAAVIARLSPSTPRRAAGTALFAALGATLLWLAAAGDAGAPGSRLVLAASGAGALWAGVRLWAATAVALELTATELREAGGGRVVARLDDIRAVARGALALKPANGFLLTLHGPAPAAWAPGLWWRVGRRVGVGGVTSRREARALAEAIVALTATPYPADA
jgi:hypothetical protein